MAITIANGSSQHTVSISSPSQEAKISNIEQWTDLFLIYAALLTEHYHLEAPHLMKYCSVVRSLAKKCTLQGWLYYDDQFRRLKAQDPSMHWANPHQELYIHCLAQFPISDDTNRALVKPTPSQQHVRRGPEGICWQLYFEGKCDFPHCRFSHNLSDKQPTSPSHSNGSSRGSTPRNHGKHASQGGQNLDPR